MIRAVIFDLGGTLEEVYYDDALRLAATPGLAEIMARYDLDAHLDPPDLYAFIQAGLARYLAFRDATLQELPVERVWTEYVLPAPQFPTKRVVEAAEPLQFYYDVSFYRRSLRPGAREALEALRAAGFSLGLISNIISRGQVPFALESYGLGPLFETVLTSSEYGRRKPHPSIFLETARRMGLAPAECAYVGDTVSRDVRGARAAAFGAAIQIKSFLTTRSDGARDVEPPDAVITDLAEVLKLVVARNRVALAPSV